MATLRKLLLEKGYHRIPIKFTQTNHLEIKVTINGIAGIFLLDTGASSSCVGFDAAKYFNLFTEESAIRAAGAGVSNMLTQISTTNEIEIGNWKRPKIQIVLFDLKHINQSLVSVKADPIRGIIGADILKKGKAVIDYRGGYLYLK